MERDEEALADFSRAIELHPGYTSAIASRGQVYQAMQRYEEALADLSRAIELDPGCASAIASRGETYQLMERYEEALADLNRLIELNPVDAPGHRQPRSALPADDAVRRGPARLH